MVESIRRLRKTTILTISLLWWSSCSAWVHISRRFSRQLIDRRRPSTAWQPTTTRLHPLASPARTRSCRYSAFLSVEECIYLYQQSSDDGQQTGRVKFVDGTWFHKGTRVGRQEFELGPRIPGSVYFDIDDVSPSNPLLDQTLLPNKSGDEASSSNPKDLLHMLPSPALFGAVMKEFNIAPTDHVVVYGRRGHAFLPRVWFTFWTRGQRRVSVMRGTLEDWMARNGPTDAMPTVVPRAADILRQRKASGDAELRHEYPASVPFDAVVTKLQVREALGRTSVPTGGGGSSDSPTDHPPQTGRVQLLDARGSSYARKGHIPGSIHIPYSSLTDADGRWKSPDELRELFAAAGVDPLDAGTTLICTCGSGVSACSLWLALRECGRPMAPAARTTLVYDGSWDEWSRDAALPKVPPDQTVVN